MTPEQITQINNLCATEIMGWKLVGKNNMPTPSQYDKWFDEETKTYPYDVDSVWNFGDVWNPYASIAQAMEVASSLRTQWVLSYYHNSSNPYSALVISRTVCEVSAVAETAAAALTLACLKAKGVEIPTAPSLPS